MVSFLHLILTIAWVITTSRWARISRKLDHSKKEGDRKPCFSGTELACRQLVLGANAAVTRCLRRVFLRSGSIKLASTDVSDSISLSQAVWSPRPDAQTSQSPQLLASYRLAIGPPTSIANESPASCSKVGSWDSPFLDKKKARKTKGRLPQLLQFTTFAIIFRVFFFGKYGCSEDFLRPGADRLPSSR